MSNTAIVPPEPQETERVLMRRPAMRRVLAACVLLAIAAAFVWFRFADDFVAMVLAGASALAGTLALVLRIIERPRLVKVRVISPRPAGPVIH